MACGVKIFSVEDGVEVPVVMACLTTTYQQQFWSDNGGWVLLSNMELVENRATFFFYVQADGYTIRGDMFSFKGLKLKLEPGKSYRIQMQRTVEAQRLHRTTGYGLYCNTDALFKLGIINESKNAKSIIAGQDSVQCASYKGKLWFFWGDTTSWEYPIMKNGFRSVCAYAEKTSITQSRPIRYTYLMNEDQSFTRAAVDPANLFHEMKDITDFDIATIWTSGVTTVCGKNEKETMVAHGFARLRDSGEQYIVGALVWNDECQIFHWEKTLHSNLLHRENVNVSFQDIWQATNGAVTCKDSGNVYFCTPFPLVTVPSSLDSWCDALHYSFTPSVRSIEWQYKNSSIPIPTHRGSVHFNDYLKQYIMVFGAKRWNEEEQTFQSEMLGGEVFYSQSSNLFGPWKDAVRIVDHTFTGMTFYNVNHHPQLDNGSTIYFEGTFTTHFAPKTVKPVPFYDYNNIMYSLDLSTLHS